MCENDSSGLFWHENHLEAFPHRNPEELIVEEGGRKTESRRLRDSSSTGREGVREGERERKQERKKEGD